MLELPQLPKLKSGLTPEQFAVAYSGAFNDLIDRLRREKQKNKLLREWIKKHK